jgi:hypothetical protein
MYGDVLCQLLLINYAVVTSMRLRNSKLSCHFQAVFLEQHGVLTSTCSCVTYTNTLLRSSYDHSCVFLRFVIFFLACRSGVVSVVTRLWAGRSGVRISAAASDFYLLHIQICPGAHPAFYSMCPAGSFPGGKRPGRNVDHSPPAHALAE